MAIIGNIPYTQRVPSRSRELPGVAQQLVWVASTRDVNVSGDGNCWQSAVDDGAPFPMVAVTLWWTYKKQLKMAIEIVDFPIKNGDVPLFIVDFPMKNCDFP